MTWRYKSRSLMDPLGFFVGVSFNKPPHSPSLVMVDKGKT